MRKHLLHSFIGGFAIVIHYRDGSPLLTIHPVVLTAVVTVIGTLLNHLLG